MLYEYAGKHPEVPPDGNGVARPGAVWRFDEEPGWGAWRELDAEEAAALETAEGAEEPGWRRDPDGPADSEPGTGASNPGGKREVTQVSSTGQPDSAADKDNGEGA